MSSSITDLEVQELAELKLQINELLDIAREHVAEELDELKATRTGRGQLADSLRASTEGLLRDLLIARGLADAGLRAQFDEITGKHNAIVDRIRARDRRIAERKQAAAERKALRAQVCPECFTIHAGDCS